MRPTEPLTVPGATFTGPHTAPPDAPPQLALTPPTPAGSVSLNVAPVAALGPALLITSCQLIGAPGNTLAGPDLTSDTSVTLGPGTVDAEPLLFPVAGSTSFTAATDAVFVSGLAPVYGDDGITSIVSIAVEPTGTQTQRAGHRAGRESAPSARVHEGHARAATCR